MNLDLSPITLSFSSEKPGDTTGENWEGVFSIKPVLSYAEKFESDHDRRALMGNPKMEEQVATEVQNIAFALAQLRSRVVTGPTWFTESQGLRTGWLDNNVVYDLLEKVLNVETKWREELKKKAEAAKAMLTK